RGLHKHFVEAIEERAKRADAEDDLVASGRPFCREHIAVLLLMDDSSLSRCGLRHKQACAKRIGRGATIGDESVAGGTEGRQVRAGEAQLIVRVAAKC